MFKKAMIFVLALTQSIAFADFNSEITVSAKLRNDNPFLNLFPDIAYEDNDHGFTQALDGEVTYVAEDGIFAEGERWNIRLNSEVYTKDITPEGEDLFPNDPQVFNEVTRLDATWDNLLESQRDGKIYYLVGAGLGKFNNSDDSGWGAIGQQRRWHVYKHNNLTPETTSMYDNQFGDLNETFFTSKVAIGKVIAFDERMADCQCEINRIKIEAGAEYVSIRNGSKTYLYVGIDKPIVSYGNHDFGVNFDNKINFHQSGDKELRTYGGIYYKYGSFKIKTGFTKKTGENNLDFYEYTDDNDIWMLEVEKKF
jgi:hypothetical protein